MNSKSAPTHCDNVLSELAAGAQLLHGMMPDLPQRIVAVDSGAPGFCTPTPSVPYPFDLVMRMHAAQCMLTGTPMSGVDDLPVITSMLFNLTWDRLILNVAQELSDSYEHTGLDEDARFSDLFLTPRQTLYLAWRGRVGGFEFDGLWVYRDIHCTSQRVHLRIQPVVLGRELSPTYTPMLCVPAAATWQQAVEIGSWLAAQELSEAFGGVPADIAREQMIRSLEWEPVVCLLVDLLTGPRGAELNSACAVAPRSDAGVGALHIAGRVKSLTITP